jgi:glucose-1-phosphate cytidylyltransferase
MADKNNMPVLILCGGQGIRPFGESNYIPKAMVRIGHRPIIWHIMKRYSMFGFTKFVLALGTKGELIRDYFLNYEEFTNDIKINLAEKTVNHLTSHQERDWEITLVDTGDQANSGARISRCQPYLGDHDFMLSYSDNLSDLDLDALIGFHKKHKTIATVTGVIPPYRELELKVKDGLATGFFDAAKTVESDRYVNGGYMVFSKRIFAYLNSYNECRLESEIFPKLISDRQLSVFPYHGFWRWLDTDRDYLFLQKLMANNTPFWLQKGNS